MVVIAVFRRLWPLLFLALPQCSGISGKPAPFDVTPDAPVIVVYHQGRARPQTLMTPAVRDPASLYSDLTSDTLSKVIDAPRMQELVAGLSQLGMFEQALGQPTPDATATIEVKLDDTSWVWSKHRNMAPDQMKEFIHGMAAFQQAYNSTMSFHTGSVGGTDLIEAQRAALEQHRRDTLSRERR